MLFKPFSFIFQTIFFCSILFFISACKSRQFNSVKGIASQSQTNSQNNIVLQLVPNAAQPENPMLTVYQCPAGVRQVGGACTQLYRYKGMEDLFLEVKKQILQEMKIEDWVQEYLPQNSNLGFKTEQEANMRMQVVSAKLTAFNARTKNVQLGNLDSTATQEQESYKKQIFLLEKELQVLKNFSSHSNIAPESLIFQKFKNFWNEKLSPMLTNSFVYDKKDSNYFSTDLENNLMDLILDAVSEKAATRQSIAQPEAQAVQHLQPAVQPSQNVSVSISGKNPTVWAMVHGWPQRSKDEMPFTLFSSSNAKSELEYLSFASNQFIKNNPNKSFFLNKDSIFINADSAFLNQKQNFGFLDFGCLVKISNSNFAGLGETKNFPKLSKYTFVNGSYFSQISVNVEPLVRKKSWIPLNGSVVYPRPFQAQRNAHSDWVNTSYDLNQTQGKYLVLTSRTENKNFLNINLIVECGNANEIGTEKNIHWMKQINFLELSQLLVSSSKKPVYLNSGNNLVHQGEAELFAGVGFMSTIYTPHWLNYGAVPLFKYP
jgi:hypothetical protein